MSLSLRKARMPDTRPSDAASRPRPVAPRARRTVVVALAGVAAACSSDSTGPKAAADCTTADVTTLAVGAVSAMAPGTFACIGGGSTGAEYVLIPFNSNKAATKVSCDVEATGVGTVGPAAFSIVPGTGEQPASSALDASPLSTRNTAFEAKLRAQEAALETLIPTARRDAATRGRGPLPSLAVSPSMVAIGQRVELNTNAKEACKNPVYATGRVVAMTAKSIIVDDTANPIGGPP